MLTSTKSYHTDGNLFDLEVEAVRKVGVLHRQYQAECVRGVSNLLAFLTDDFVKLKGLPSGFVLFEIQ